MKQEIKVPRLGESVSEARVCTIMKQSGASVSVDEEILELETDKVNQVISAPAAGVLTLNVKVDDVVRIDQLLGSVETEAKVVTQTANPQAVKPAEVPKPVQQQPEPEPEKQVASDGRETRKKLTSLRKTIARRLLEATHNTAMLTTFNEVDMGAIIDIRTKQKEAFLEKHKVKLGFMSFFVKAVVAAMKAVPALNAYIDGDDWVQRNFFDIGVAVGTERGLLVPVIRNADKLSFPEIEKAVDLYATKAREGKMAIDDLEGGCFTISNGGVYGSMLSTPILNPPQSGILGMHKIMPRPVVVDNQIVVRQMMYLALSYDHRVVDGREAIGFLVQLKELLEDPKKLGFEP